jgi:superfamily II DNA/RNA helicase
MDFEVETEELNQILAVVPRERDFYLFSATMTSKMANIPRRPSQGGGIE